MSISTWSRRDVRRRQYRTERYVVEQEIIRYWHPASRRWSSASVHSLTEWSDNGEDGPAAFATCAPSLPEMVAMADAQLAEVRRKVDEEIASGLHARGMSVALNLDILGLRNQRDNARRRAETAENECAWLLAAVEALVADLDYYQRHDADICGRGEACDNREDGEECDDCGTDACPACECGIEASQAVVYRARALLAEVGARRALAEQRGGRP